MPLEDLGFSVKFLSRVEVETRIGPKVRDRPRYEDSVALALQDEIAGRGQAAGTRCLAFSTLHVQIERSRDMMKLQTTQPDERNR